ncbi:MAG TPA: HEAT repeat domain-containing protein [Nitrosomonas sp.]|uniref:HEAT repeat-containing protein n=1 Tax=Nitrosomonas ureae TaxID=44577 RepID=A0A286A8C7_9PROT|nr:HEAT repeat domain-containing protein [Nitrosomonas ureae]SOD18091.1 HEAT repeat-containing protein [Nitrosomonas ureae]HRB20784.1 HEAT repeat domain-containing protein [Nitrosomonas sp.]
MNCTYFYQFFDSSCKSKQLSTNSIFYEKITHMFKHLAVMLIAIIFNMNLVFGEITNSPLSDPNKSASVTARNLHIDNITIQAAMDLKEFSLSDEDRKRLIYEISRDSKKEVIDWHKDQYLWLGIAFLLGGGAFIRYTVTSVVKNQVSRMDEVRDKAIESTRLATVEVDESRKVLDEFKDLKRTIKEEISSNSKLLKELQDKAKELDKTMYGVYDDLRDDFRGDKEYLITRLKAHDKWLKAIDISAAAANIVTDTLIDDLKGNDIDAKIEAVELLPYFAHDKEKIVGVLKEILENESQNQFGVIILSKLGEFDADDQVFDILTKYCNDLTKPNVAAVIGALGKLQENRKDDPEFIKKIVSKLINLLESLINKGQSKNENKDEIANIKNAIALALSYSGELGVEAVPLLIQLVEDSSENEYRMSAAIALGNIGEKAVHSIPALTQLSDDPRLEVTSAAQDAIDKIRKVKST